MMVSMVDIRQKGFLNKDDLVQLFGRHGWTCSNRARHIFKLLDIDSDGRVSYNDFLQLVQNRRLLPLL